MGYILSLTLFFFGVFILLPAWVLMILLGALSHLTAWPTAISYWACYVIVLILSFFVRMITIEQNKK